MNLSDVTITSENKVKLLGINIDNTLSFDYHITQLCKVASKKLHALARICKCMDIPKRKLLMNAFISSQFSYCNLIWMFHSRELENRINKIHERAIRLVYQDQSNLSFKELLNKFDLYSIHQKNLQCLAIEIFKAKNKISPCLINDLFIFKEKKCNLRNNIALKRRKDNTVHYGSETILSLAPKIWDLIPEKIKSESTLTGFKAKIKVWKTNKCPCRLCKIYVHHIGFI